MPVRKNTPSLAKLTPPQLPRVLERHRLFQDLDRLREPHRVIWIQGPPGAGKTTLVASYLKARKLRSLWYQMDEGDVDPGTWFHYLSLGMKQLVPRYKKPLPSLQPEYLPGIAVFTRRFFEQLYSRLKTPGVVVFDNYQEVGAEEAVHELVHVALRTIPEGTTVILMSRTHPPATFARLQAEQQLAIVTPDTLKLTLQETKALLHLRGGASGPQGKPGQAERLYHRTQGWLAGVVLLVSHNDSDEPAAPTAETQDVAPVVFDYFASQVFTQQPKERQEFLLHTAFFPSMTTPMAEQVTGIPEAKHYLSELARSQYFTVRHGEEDFLYQYHPLFRQFLQARIQEAWKSDDIQALQRKTAEILKQYGRYHEAFTLFHGIKDVAEVVNLILEHAPRLLTEGRSQTVEQWISNLPESVKGQHPWVLFWLAQCQVLTNPNLGADTFEQAFNLFQNGKDTLGVYSAWCGVVEAIIRTWERLPRLKQWIDLLPKLKAQYDAYPNHEIEARVTVNMFNALVWCRLDDPTIYEWEAKAIEVVEHIPDVNASIPVLCFLHTFRTHLGEIDTGEMLLQTVKDLMSQGSLSPFSQAMFYVCEAVQGWLTVDLDRCTRAVDKGLVLADEFGLAFVYLPLLDQGITAELLSGNVSSARSLAKKHWDIAQHLSGLNKATSHQMLGWVAFVEGDLEEALYHIKNALQLFHAENHLFLYGFGLCMLGQLQVERGQFDVAQNNILELEKIISRYPSHLLQAYLWMLKALCHYANDSSTKAEDCLCEWLAVSRTHKIVVSQLSMRYLYSRLFLKALEAGIEVECVRGLIGKMNLVPEHPLLTSDTWPWPVRVYTLGRFILMGEAGAIQFGRKVPKTPLALLKLLIALGGKAVSQNQVTEWLWPDADGDAAYRSLITTLSRLRKLLKNEDAILFSDGTLSINSSICWVDSLSFQHLIRQSEIEAQQGNSAKSRELAERASELYKGEFLPHNDESWVLPIREHLHKQHVSLTEHVQCSLS